MHLPRFAEAKPRFSIEAWRRQDCVKRLDNMVDFCFEVFFSTTEYNYL